MKLEAFNIIFDSPHGVFTAGSVLSGKVNIHLKKPMKMIRIVIYFEGKSKSHWETGDSRNRKHYRARETYLTESIVLFGSATGGSSVEHPEGHHSYPFSLALPATFPSSFQGLKGYVRYSCKATIFRPWKFDEERTKCFTVIHQLDLNAYSNAAIPIVHNENKEVEGCCCAAGQFSVQFVINKTGFVSGEPLTYTIDIDNRSSEVVNKVTLELKQEVTYTGYSDSIFSSGHPKFKTNTEHFSLFSAKANIRARSTGQFHRAVSLPALPPSNLEGCGIIDITYYLVLKVAVGWTQIKVMREIIIGTIPLNPPMAAPPPSFESVAALQPTAPYAPPPYSEAPPPSYEECVFGTNQMDDGEEDGQMSAFTPAYPYYTWNPNAPNQFDPVVTAQPRPSNEIPLTPLANQV